jgi:hypothetical protein
LALLGSYELSEPSASLLLGKYHKLFMVLSLATLNQTKRVLTHYRLLSLFGDHDHSKLHYQLHSCYDPCFRLLTDFHIPFFLFILLMMVRIDQGLLFL